MGDACDEETLQGGSRETGVQHEDVADVPRWRGWRFEVAAWEALIAHMDAVWDADLAPEQRDLCLLLTLMRHTVAAVGRTRTAADGRASDEDLGVAQMAANTEAGLVQLAAREDVLEDLQRRCEEATAEWQAGNHARVEQTLVEILETCMA